jgi:hypothetical protein
MEFPIIMNAGKWIGGPIRPKGTPREEGPACGVLCPIQLAIWESAFLRYSASLEGTLLLIFAINRRAMQETSLRDVTIEARSPRGLPVT